MELSPIQKEKLADIRKYLPHGTGKKVAKKHGVTPAYVSAVKHGVYFNVDILESLIEIANTERKRLETMMKKIG